MYGDEIGMRLMLRAGHQPDWERAQRYLEQFNAIDPQADADDRQRAALLAHWLGDTGPDNILEELDGQTIDSSFFDHAREVIDSALAGENEYVQVFTVAGHRVIEAAPNTGSSDAMEFAYNYGILSAAGFEIEID